MVRRAISYRADTARQVNTALISHGIFTASKLQSGQPTDKVIQTGNIRNTSIHSHLVREH
jgi:hypothetical protein